MIVRRWSFTHRLAASVVGTAWLLASASSHAALFDDDEARKAILDLRAKVEVQHQDRLATQRAQAEEITQLRRSLLDLNNLIEQLRAELARSRGAQELQLNALANDVAAVQKRQKDQVQVTEERLRELEPVQVTLDGKQVSVDPAEKRAFDAPLALFKASEFSRAASGFNEFLTRYPRSVFGAQSFYYLGNAFYGQKDCRQAIEAFMQLATKHPGDTRAPEALLSSGNCHLEMGNKPAARRAYDSIIKLYPQAEDAATAKDRLARIK